MLGKIYGKLSAGERRECESFLQTHANLDRNEFAMKAARLYMDVAQKPKRLGSMIELLLAANSRG